MATESTGERRRRTKCRWEESQEARGWWHEPQKGMGTRGIRKRGALGGNENTGLFGSLCVRIS